MFCVPSRCVLLVPTYPICSSMVGVIAYWTFTLYCCTVGGVNMGPGRLSVNCDVCVRGTKTGYWEASGGAEGVHGFWNVPAAASVAEFDCEISKGSSATN